MRYVFDTLLCAAAFLAAYSPLALAADGSAHHDDPHADAAHHGETAGLPQLDFATYPSQIFWMIVFFGILYLIFSKKTLPEISSTIEDRRTHIQNDLHTAGKLRNEAENVHEAYDAAIEKAKEEASKVFKESEEKSKERIQKEMDSFYARAAKEIEATEKKIEQTKNEALEEMNVIAAEIASDIAQKIIGIPADINQAKTVVESIHNKKKAA